MQYQTVINKIGGGVLREAARQLRIPIKTVHDWRKSGTVPHWREAHVRAVAQRLGVNVDVDVDQKIEA